MAQEQVRQFAEQAQAAQSAALAEEFPYLAEVVAGHVAKVGYDFTAAFEYGLDLILDALERVRGDDQPASAAESSQTSGRRTARR